MGRICPYSHFGNRITVDAVFQVQPNPDLPSLPEISIVRADMTRTSLVDGITPFCFTCANNIRLVCGNCKELGFETI